NQEVTAGVTFANEADVTTNTIDQTTGESSEGFIKIDGEKIYYNSKKDTIQDLATRINDSGIDVKAVFEGSSGTEYDPGDVPGSSDGAYQFKLKSRTPHQIFLKDFDRTPDSSPGSVEGLLDDLEILDGSGGPREEQNFPNPYHSNATVDGKSLFDALMSLRESLQPSSDPDTGNFQKGAASTSRSLDPATKEGVENSLEDLQIGIDNLSVNRSVGGARINRMESAEVRAQDFEVNTKKLVSQVKDADISKVITKFRQQKLTQQASLRMSQQVLNLSLANLI
ncbi:MAG: hypothetical protein ABEJ65_08025, partial [bacterium]